MKATIHEIAKTFYAAADIGIDRLAKNEILYNIAPTSEQAAFIDCLVQFAKTESGELYVYFFRLNSNL